MQWPFRGLYLLLDPHQDNRLTGRKEGRTGIVALPDDNPRVVELMIRFFYYLDYPKLPEIWQDKSPEAAQDEKQWLSAGWGPPQPESEESIGPNLTIHAMVYALGEKYDIQGLKALSLEKFKKEARSYWDSDDFLRAVEEVYTSTIDADRGMRDAVVDAIRQHSTVLDKESMQAVVRRVEPLCFDLMMGFRPGTQMQTVKPFRRARGLF